MRRPFLRAALPLSLALAAPAADPLAMQWDPGAEDCAAHPQPRLEVRDYDPTTFILREGLCSTFEAPFIYLLVGAREALLVDTGAVADPGLVPLADTVRGLLPGDGPSRLPLTVMHTHRHLDHRAGDAQFASLPNVKVVPPELEAVRAHFGLHGWPEGVAQVDLGGRIVDVVPAPGHHATELVLYDRNTHLLLTGDFLLPGRILVDDLAAYRASADRIARFVADRPVSHVLGAHVEVSRSGELFPWGSQHHPGERPLPLAKADVLALQKALREFNGFYREGGGFVVSNPIRTLVALAAAAVVVLAGLAIGLLRFVRRRRRARLAA